MTRKFMREHKKVTLILIGAILLIIAFENLVAVGLQLKSETTTTLKTSTAQTIYDTKEARMQLFAVVSIVILLGMAVLYIFAYRFYSDLLFLFISIAWFCNGIYIFFEGFFPSRQDDLDFNIFVFTLSILPSVFFLIGSYCKPQKSLKQLKQSKALWSTLAWITQVAVCFLAADIYLHQYSTAWTVDRQFALIAFSGVALSAWAPFTVGQSLSRRLMSDVHGKYVKVIFPATFYGYAIIQPLYPFKLFPEIQQVITLTFFFAFTLKMLNSFCALSTMRSDFVNSQEELHQKSILEDIGALTASIEHDIRNPLGVMETELGALRLRFQADNEIVSAIKRLEQQRKRILVAAGIVPVLRGDTKFYKRFLEKTSVKGLLLRCRRAVLKELDPQRILIKVLNDNGTHEPVFAKAHGPLVEQAVVNVLKNAIEAIHEADRESGLIQIEYRNFSKEEVSIHIHDNGIGIRPELIHRVTEIFTTKEADKRNAGIGLFVADRIVKMHGGRIEIESEVGKGTTVVLYLQRA